MTPVIPAQWLAVQRDQGRDVCLVLDAQNEIEVRTALLKERAYDRYCSVYSQTPVAELAAAGPFLIVLDTADATDSEHLTELLHAPERHWGWLASLAQGDLPAWLAHWRARCLVGASPNRALYRFQDNRVLARALGHLSTESLPAYLGVAISACYWQGEHWAITDNPMPGEYSLPQAPAWLSVPSTSAQLNAIRETNALRFLLDQHQQAYLQVAQQQPVLEWISQQCTLANTWGWHASEQLEFLLVHSLKSTGFQLPKQWHPLTREDPTAHYQRVSHLALFRVVEGAV